MSPIRGELHLIRISFRRFLAWFLVSLWLAACGTGLEQRDKSADGSSQAASRAGEPGPSALSAGDTVAELQAAMSRGEVSAQDLTQHFLDQIDARNSELNAVIAVNPKALDAARELDAERAAGNLRGPLHGIPVLIKDNIETRELPTTAGSLALKDNHTRRDATVVARLRAAGAVILGKANLSEWANFRSERSSSGWSAVGGQARNPHDTSRSPCGSSSGSGIAVAAGMAVVALGTETDGSVTCPATVNGIVGIKPTVGLVSRTGIVPISHTQDTAGPMTRNVADAALLLSVMAGPDPADAATQVGEKNVGQDYTTALDPNALQGKRIGVLRSATGYHEGVDALLEGAIQILESGGATIVEDLKLEPYDGFDQDTYDILLYEFKHDLNAYLASLPNELSSLTLEKLIQFNEEHAADEMDYFRQEVFKKSQEKGPLTEDGYRNALSKARKATRQEGIDKLLREHQLDALIAPTSSPAWTIDLVNGDHFIGGFSTYPAVAGYPHVTLPMGEVHGLPVGLSFAGTAFDEHALIGMAFAYEQLRKVRAGS